LTDEHAAPYVKLGLLKKLEIDEVINAPKSGLTLFYRYGSELSQPIADMITFSRDYASEHF
jgi:hypothetical protein